MPEKSKRGGYRKGAGRKSKASKLIQAGFVANWFTDEFQEIKWKSLANSSDERIAIEAMKYLSDRLYGKAKQAVEHSGPEGGPIRAAVTVEFVANSQNAAA
jgi:hypothetical protein